MNGPVDVFLVVGQSNAVGTGDPSDAPTPPSGIAYEYRTADDELVALAEPVGPEDGGSAWAAFACEYHERTDRTVVIVSKPVGGAALHPDADLGAGHWSRGGALRRRATDSLIACLDLLEARGIEHTLRGILWHQGESDALAIDEDEHTVENYESAFHDLVNYFREALADPALALFQFKIGRPLEADTAAWRAVRAAQDRIAVADDRVDVVSDVAVTFAERGLMQDELHYDQTGYNEMGREGGRRIAAAVDDRSTGISRCTDDR